MVMKPSGLVPFFFFAVLSILFPSYAYAGTNDYPTSIAGCKNWPSGGATFTADLRDSPGDTLSDPWGEINRECVSFAAWELSYRNGFTMPFHDQAFAWGPDAQSRSYAVNSQPGVGSIAWWGKTASTPNGHVAWVESISQDGSHVTVAQYNVPANSFVWSEQTIATSAPTGYIHFKDIVQANTEPFYRLVNNSIGQHFFTVDPNERANLLNGGYWQIDGPNGIACNLQTTSANGWVPFTRWRNTNTQGHLYTCNPSEIGALQGDPADWVRETDMGYIAPPTGPQPAGTVGLFRFCCDTYGDHFYTETVAEVGGVNGNGNGSNGTYRGEGCCGYVWP